MTDHKRKSDTSKFPADFLWGASTASHQVEGGTRNQWSEWELANAAELARTAKKRIGWVPVWGKIRSQAENPANYISGNGVEHYKRYKKDFSILQELGLNSFRFSIEWARVQPAEDTWDAGAIQHYHRYITELNRRGIEPVLTLWHWTMPTWFTDKGAFTKPRNLIHFDRFVTRMAQEYGSKVRYVITLNEPNIYASFSYLSGEWPPEQKSVLNFARTYWNLTRVHKRAYRILKTANPDITVGIAAQLGNMQPKRPGNRLDRFVASMAAYGNNWWFLNRIRYQQDFVGLNYYFTNYWRGRHEENPKMPLSNLGWYMEPKGLLPLMLQVHKRYKLPIVITENGLADTEDKQRKWWIEETMEALQAAREQGVGLTGYLHWSLLDNFEWKYGWWPNFGLVAVDRAHGMKRTVRGSAHWWAEYIKTNTSKSK